MPYNVILDTLALEDLQEAIDYYDQQKVGLGKKFDDHFDKLVSTLEINPFFQVRYDTVRCLPMKSFPYMIHYTINQTSQTVNVFAVINTSKYLSQLS
jgi:toxin ParE1/3/4